MLPLWASILLFFPVFLVICMVCALPGKVSIQEARRAGLRQFLVGSAWMLFGSLAFSLISKWFLGRAPLW